MKNIQLRWHYYSFKLDYQVNNFQSKKNTNCIAYISLYISLLIILSLKGTAFENTIFWETLVYNLEK